MIEWLTDTLVMTGVLMALVLLVRRPVSRWFGPAAAYALWALPLLRLVLPPLALPRGLFARPQIAVEPITATAHGVLPPASPIVETAVTAVPSAAIPVQASVPVEPGLLAQIPWFSVLVAVWLLGAAIFLFQRLRNYRLMRAELMADARLVAHSGDIRIVETSAAASPLAFGVRDRVVALPQGFLATVDSESSDFAIAHELEHHAGNDLLALIVLQPLFALHWFNPIGWAAWRALRADQEAACDARVMTGCNRDTRARYGRVIASFAAGSRLTLAAPIAGALAGEKPIIQRLKALATLEVSPARRVMARSLFAFAVVAVPCTATVTYAAIEEPEAPEAPAAPQAVAAPIAPAAPRVPSRSDWQDVPEVPEPADAAVAPETPWAPTPPAPPPAPSAHVSEADVLPVPPAPPMPPEPPVAPSHARAEYDQTARRLSQDARRIAAEARRNAPQVEQSTSSNGKIQTIRIIRKDGEGGPKIQQTITIDSTCPADRARANRGPASTTYVCTGVPREALNAAARAIVSAKATVAANHGLDVTIRNQILAELDKELADARADMQGETN